MKKNRIETLLPNYRLPLDKIGSGINIVDIPFESGKRYKIEYETGKYLCMTFKEMQAESGKNIMFTEKDITITNIVRSIKYDKETIGEEPTFTLTDIVNIMYRGNNNKRYFEDTKKRLDFLRTTEVTIDYTDYYNELVKKDARLDLRDITNWVINLKRERAVTNGIEHIKYTVLDTPLQFYTELTKREITVPTRDMLDGKITNKRLGIRSYLLTRLGSKNITEVTIEKMLVEKHIRKDPHKRYLKDIDEEVKDIAAKGLNRYENIHYRDRNNKKVSDIKDAYKISIKK